LIKQYYLFYVLNLYLISLLFGVAALKFEAIVCVSGEWRL